MTAHGCWLYGATPLSVMKRSGCFILWDTNLFVASRSSDGGNIDRALSVLRVVACANEHRSNLYSIDCTWTFLSETSNRQWWGLSQLVYELHLWFSWRNIESKQTAISLPGLNNKLYKELSADQTRWWSTGKQRNLYPHLASTREGLWPLLPLVQSSNFRQEAQLGLQSLKHTKLRPDLQACKASIQISKALSVAY